MNLYEAILGERNRIYYLTRFEQYDEKGSVLKAGWNWPAFFFGYIWALYRKMYGWFFAYLGITLLAIYFVGAGFAWWPSIAITLVWITFTIYANSLYHNNIKKKIAAAQDNVKGEPKLLEHLRHKGGVHRWVMWTSVVLTFLSILGAILVVIPFIYTRF